MTTNNWAVWLWRSYLAVVLLFVFAPAISLIVFSFQESKIQTFPITSYSLRWYQNALENEDIKEGLSNSLIVGVSASLLSSTLGFLSSHLLCRTKIKRPIAYVALVSLPVVVPLLLSGMALLVYFQQVHINGNLLAIIIAHTCFCSPFAMALIRGPYEQLNIEIEYAANNLGAGQSRIIFQIVIPQLLPVLAASALLSFLISWDEFILAWFVGGFEKTLPVVIYGMMGTSFNPSLNAVGTLSMGISAILLLVVFSLKGMADRRIRGEH